MARKSDRVLRRVTATAPVRIADVGGWTDTWFARTGAVCHLGVGPGVEVQAVLGDGPAASVELIAPDLGERYDCRPSPSRGWVDPEPGRHPLLEHAVASVCAEHPLPGPVTVTIRSAVPPGASLGTSASVVVAVIAALGGLLDPADPMARIDATDLDRGAVAEAAHRVETTGAGRQAGVQDQYAAAFGLAQLVEITDYPTAHRRPIDLESGFAQLLDSCTVTVVVGAHDSSSVHQAVIDALGVDDTPLDAGADPHTHLDELRGLAFDAAAALHAGDLGTWATTLTAATRAQEGLHPDLVGPAHRALIARARADGALGWKVNGAGGVGGSLTVVWPSPGEAERFAAAVQIDPNAWSVQALRLQDGVTLHHDD